MTRTHTLYHKRALYEYRRSARIAVDQLVSQLEDSPHDDDLLQCLVVARAMLRLAELDLWTLKVRKRDHEKYVEQVFVCYDESVNADDLREAAFAYYAACRRMSSTETLSAYVDFFAKQTKMELKLHDSARVFTVRREE